MRAHWRAGQGLRVALVLAVDLALPRVAQAETESVHIDYAAPTNCPDATTVR